MGLCNSKPSPYPNSPKSDPIPNKNSSIPTKEKPVPGENKPVSTSTSVNGENNNPSNVDVQNNTVNEGKKSPFFPFYSPSPAHYFFSKKSSPARSSANSTPKRFFKRPFPPPSPAKHIKAVLARRHGSVKPNEASIPEGSEAEAATGLDKSFGFSKNFINKYELEDEVGRGHFGYTCAAKFKKGELKGQQVAVKVIPKAKVCIWLNYLI